MGKVENSDNLYYVDILIDGIIILMPTLPYIPQYIKILQSEDSSGFSKYVCLFSVLANTLRIIYWFGVGYEKALLIQSGLLLCLVFLMLELCVRMELRQAQYKGQTIEKRTFLDFKLKNFWEWTDLSSYFLTAISFATLSTLIFFCFGEYRAVVTSIGFVALFLEATLSLPQLVRNWKRGSTAGLSYTMVFLFVIVHTLKLFYYLRKHVPWPFMMCVTIQLTTDFLITLQVIWYGVLSGGESHTHHD